MSALRKLISTLAPVLAFDHRRRQGTHAAAAMVMAATQNNAMNLASTAAMASFPQLGRRKRRYAALERQPGLFWELKNSWTQLQPDAEDEK